MQKRKIEKQNKVRIREAFNTISLRKKKIVERDFDANINGKNVGYIRYGVYAKDMGFHGFSKSFEKYANKHDGSINFVVVEKGYMNRGIGKKLLDRAEREAKKDKRKRLLLTVSGKKKKNISIYKNRGYKKIAKKTDRFQGKKNTWILMAKELK
jgi:ribosomal protein S18 acetylase RimI-like enzyme